MTAEFTLELCGSEAQVENDITVNRHRSENDLTVDRSENDFKLDRRSENDFTVDRRSENGESDFTVTRQPSENALTVDRQPESTSTSKWDDIESVLCGVCPVSAMLALIVVVHSGLCFIAN